MTRGIHLRACIRCRYAENKSRTLIADLYNPNTSPSVCLYCRHGAFLLRHPDITMHRLLKPCPKSLRSNRQMAVAAPFIHQSTIGTKNDPRPASCRNVPLGVVYNIMRNYEQAMLTGSNRD